MQILSASSRVGRFSKWSKTPLPVAHTAATLLLLSAASVAAWLPPQTRHALPAPLAHRQNGLVATANGPKLRLVATGGMGEAVQGVFDSLGKALSSIVPIAPGSSSQRQMGGVAPRADGCSTVVTNTSDAGAGSLRAAVDCSNAGATAQTISFAPSVSGTILLTSGQLTLTQSATIVGPGANVLTVAGNSASYLNVIDATASRVLQVNGGVTATIAGLTVRNGGRFAPSDATAQGGGILNNGTLTLNACEISHNNLVGAASASGNGVGGNVQGAGIFNAGTLTLNNSTLDNNVALSGSGSSLATEGIAKGGGIYNASGATTLIQSSTFVLNAALAGALTFKSDITVAPLASGGGVWSDGPLTLRNSTLGINSAGLSLSTTTGQVTEGGGIFVQSGVAALSSTIVAQNASGGVFGGNSSANDVYGATGGSFNLIGSGFGMTGISNGAGHNQVGTQSAPINPRFQPLQFNGGPTRVLPLGVGSPALDQGTSSGFTTDQRGTGYPRIFNQPSITDASDGADVGAYELQFSDLGACTTVVSNTSDYGPGTLRRAMDCANATPAADTISFAIPGAGVHTITPPSPLPALTAPVTIDGFTQSGSTTNTNVEGALTARPTIELDFEDNPLSSPGLAFSAGSDGSTVRGLIINRFGTGGSGVTSVSTGSANNIAVKGCFIGTDATGTRAFITSYASGDGIAIGGTGFRVGGPLPADRNLISGVNNLISFTENLTSDVEIRGNLLGPDVSGAGVVANGATGAGISIAAFGDVEASKHPDGLIHDVRIGMPGAGGGNVISGNRDGANVCNGISILTIKGFSDAPAAAFKNIQIRNNRIGTNALGTAALPNGTTTSISSGISVYDFSGLSNGISGLQIGGINAGEGNVISGNTGKNDGVNGSGISLEITGATIQGNFIGTDATGTSPIPNTGSGIFGDCQNTVVGGASATARNVISGNGGDGVAINGGNNSVKGNFIGTDAAGTAKLGNAGAGVRMGGIGGNSVQSNTVAFNGNAGVVVTNTLSKGNTVSQNSIHDNGKLGIDLGGDGVTLNQTTQPTKGANFGQNFPVISGISGGVASATLASAPNINFTVEFFVSPAPDASGYGQGQTYLGAKTVATDATGNTGTFAFTLPSGASGYLTATATDAGSPTGATDAAPLSTSEFSKAVLIPGTTVTPTAAPTPTATAATAATAVPPPTATAAPTPTAAPTATATVTPTAVPTATGVPVATATPKPSPTATPTATATPVATATPKPAPTATSVPVPTATPVPSKAVTQTAIASSLNPSKFGQSVTLTAKVSVATTSAGKKPGKKPRQLQAAPTGSVTFFDAGGILGTGTITGGVATFSTSTLSVMTHALTALYAGDANFNGSTSNTLSQVVTGDPVLSVSQTASAPTVGLGGSATFSIVVKNTGTATAPAVVVFDTLPASATFVSATGGTVVQSGQNLTFTVGALGVGASQTLSVTVTAPATVGTLINSVTASATGATGTPTAPVPAQVQVTNGAPAFTFGIGKLIYIGPYTPSLYRPGGHFIQTVTITNTGTASATGPLQLVLDSLPSMVTLVGATGASASGAPFITVPLAGNTLGVGGSTSIRLEFRLKGGAKPTFTPRIASGTGG